MNSSSIKHLSDQLLVTVRRFPLALLAAVGATACLIQWSADPTHHNLYVRLLMTSYLGMMLFTGASIFFERYNFRKTSVVMALAAIVAFLVYYYFSLPIDLHLKAISRFAMLILASHLAVSFAPFLVDIEINGFWQYNKTLFLRFLSAALYSVVLFCGLSLALLAIDKLFAIEIGSHVYTRLGFFVAGIFNTTFFLAGVPVKVESLESDHSYPKGLRIFTQYVLLPLVTFYLLILYAYTAKILIAVVWPRGWVSYLVIGFSTLGILALLLVWPRKDEEKHKWIRNYIRSFFYALFPLILLLAFAIGRRVKAYGVTENRYFVIVLALWLFVNALYFLFSKLKNIKFIPMSLFVVTLLSGYGPWSSFNVSQHSQKHRLVKLFKKYNLIKNGFLVKASDQLKIKDEDLNEISSVTYYLCNEHGVTSMQPFFKQRLDSMLATKPAGGYYEKPERILGLANIDFHLRADRNNSPNVLHLNYSANTADAINVTGFTYEVPFNIYTSSNEEVIVQSRNVGTGQLNWSYKKGEWQVIVNFNDQRRCSINCKPLVDSLIAAHGYSFYQLGQDEMMIHSVCDSMELQLNIHGLAGNILKDSQRLELSELNGTLLLKIK
jgi:hypothetical protein